MTEPHLEHSIFGGHEDAHEAAEAAQRIRSPGGPAPPRAAPRKRGGRRLGCLFVALAIVAVAAFAAYTRAASRGRRLPGEQRLPGAGHR